MAAMLFFGQLVLEGYSVIILNNSIFISNDSYSSSFCNDYVVQIPSIDHSLAVFSNPGQIPQI